MLKPVLGRWDSVAISIGIVIGVGIFRVPKEVAEHIQSPAWIIFAWVVGGLFSFLGALCYAELAAMFPRSGGDYIYLKEAYGNVLAFLFAWSELLITRTGSVAAVALWFGEYLCALFSLTDVFIRPVAVAIIIVLTMTNLFGLRQSSRLQNFLTITKVGALLLVIAAGAMAFHASANTFNIKDLLDISTAQVGQAGQKIHALPGGASPPSPLVALFVALVPILWTYGGWRDNVFLAGETKDAKSSVPFALLITCLVVTVVYCLMNVLYLLYLPVATIKDSPLFAAEVLAGIFGSYGAKLFESLIVLYGLGVINGLLLTGSYLAQAMSEDNFLFNALSKTDPKTNMPVRALIFNGLWACLLTVTGTFEKLMFFTGLFVWIFFALVAVSVMLFRFKKIGEQKILSGPASFIIPPIVALVSLALALSTAREFPTESIFGAIIVFSGVPIFLAQKWIKRSTGRS